MLGCLSDLWLMISLRTFSSICCTENKLRLVYLLLNYCISSTNISCITPRMPTPRDGNVTPGQVSLYTYPTHYTWSKRFRYLYPFHRVWGVHMDIHFMTIIYYSTKNKIVLYIWIIYIYIYYWIKKYIYKCSIFIYIIQIYILGRLCQYLYLIHHPSSKVIIHNNKIK
jgi:hypothetical protein